MRKPLLLLSVLKTVADYANFQDKNFYTNFTDFHENKMKNNNLKLYSNFAAIREISVKNYFDVV